MTYNAKASFAVIRVVAHENTSARVGSTRKEPTSRLVLDEQGSSTRSGRRQKQRNAEPTTLGERFAWLALRLVDEVRGGSLSFVGRAMNGIDGDQ